VIVRAIATFDESNNDGSWIVIEGKTPSWTFRLLFGFERILRT
jgi:hypothetical protein